VALRPRLWPGVPWGVAEGHPEPARPVQALSSQELAPLARPTAPGPFTPERLLDEVRRCLSEWSARPAG
jgi:hypothetical protein